MQSSINRLTIHEGLVIFKKFLFIIGILMLRFVHFCNCYLYKQYLAAYSFNSNTNMKEYIHEKQIFPDTKRKNPAKHMEGKT